MTIDEAVAKVDALRQNLIPFDVKVGWLQTVDRTVYEEIIRGRVGEEDVPYPTYGNGDGDMKLLIPSPYDEIYVYRLEAEIFYTLNEVRKQANALTRYNELMSAYAAKYAREHRAKPHVPVVYY